MAAALSRSSRDLPERIGRYVVLGPLAAGGMAEILLARLVGPSGFHRPVVIKRILPHLARQSRFVDMFIDEARIAAVIQHPNVVQVLELGHEEDEVFIVMEYLEGESTAGLLRRLVARGGRLGYELAAYIVAEACAGLHAAHELIDEDGITRTLVHRDVSPQNIFVTYVGAVKVLDFGIAKATDRSTQTEAGQVKGKFAYMSPEQCKGQPLDRRSDIFSLGILLFELATGMRLFQRGNDLATLKAICEDRIRQPRDVDPVFPASLAAVCTRALARRREDRYQTAAEMRKDLVRVVRDLDPVDDPGDMLASLMQKLFGDRIEAKRNMLHQFESGMNVTHIPEAETDESVEAPPVHEDPPIGQTTSASHDRPRSRRRAVGVAVLSAAVFGVALGASQTAARPVERLQSGLAPVASRRLVLSSIGSSASDPAPTASPVTTKVKIDVETVPSGAMVLVSGKSSGKTPLSLEMARGDAPLELELRRSGYLPLRERIVPDKDQRLRLTLRTAARRSAPEEPTMPKFR